MGSSTIHGTGVHQARVPFCTGSLWTELLKNWPANTEWYPSLVDSGTTHSLNFKYQNFLNKYQNFLSHYKLKNLADKLHSHSYSLSHSLNLPLTLSISLSTLSDLLNLAIKLSHTLSISLSVSLSLSFSVSLSLSFSVSL